MALSDAAPCNTDILQPNKFILAFPRVIPTAFFCQAVTIPGVSTANPTQNTPLLDLAVPGDKLRYDDLMLTFLVDEELLSWSTVYNWMKGLTFPHSFDEYKELGTLSRYSETVPFPQYADAELIILSTVNKPTIKFKFKDCFPVQLSGINMDIREGSEHTLIATAVFKYKYYDLERVV